MAKTSKSSTDKGRTKPSVRDMAKNRNSSKKRQLKARSSSIAKPFKAISRPLGWFLKKLGWFVPGYFKGAWSEIRQTTWPNRRETARLTVAVFIFSAVFATFVATLDLLLDKIFKGLIIK